jgi:hypothetical protein
VPLREPMQSQYSQRFGVVLTDGLPRLEEVLG